jgi:hypothetical protein
MLDNGLQKFFKINLGGHKPTKDFARGEERDMKK